MTRLTTAFLLVLACVLSSSHGVEAQSAPTSGAQEQPPSASAPDNATSTPPAAQPSAKKVWTEDDMHGLRGTSPISTVGTANAKPAPGGKKVVATPNEINSYRNRILQLQAKLPDIDSKIADLQKVLSGTAVNTVRTTGGTKIDDWGEELKKLQQQRDDTATKISALQDEARHRGVPDNQIP
jgi:hypothetical protein